MESIEKKFEQENKITLREAIDRINRKSSEAIDYNFLVMMYDDENYKPIVQQQIDDINNRIKELLTRRDNFTERMVIKVFEDIDKSKRVSDDTRMSERVIDKNKLIDSMLSSDYKFNPLIQINPHLYQEKRYPILFNVTKEFRRLNKDYVEPIYYSGGRNLRGYSVERGYEQYISINRDMVTDINLIEYPFYIRWLIQEGDFNSLFI